mgnify:CR=1 FL=1
MAGTAGALMCRRRRPAVPVRMRKGAALLIVLGALALLGALSVAGLGAVLHAQRAGRRSSVAASAFAAAEGARATAMGEWSARVPPDLAVGSSVGWSAGSWNGATTTVTVTRLAPLVVRLEGHSSAPGPANERAARRSTAALWIVQPPMLTVHAALTAGAEIVSGAAAATEVRLDGRDSLVAGWNCSAADTASLPALATGAAVTLPPSSLVGGWLADSGASLAARYQLAWPAPDTLRWAPPLIFAGDLTAAPIAPRLDGVGGCRTGSVEPTNWGDPQRPSACSGWLPLIHLHGNLDGPVGRGQGLLLVDGDLTLRGDFRFDGVIVVGGRLSADGAGNLVTGAILARGAGAGSHELRALRLRYSSCVVRGALAAAGVLRPTPARGWAEWW